MLYLLSGEIQTGKTRWLTSLITELEDLGIVSYGVLAPGRWISSDSQFADCNGFEKLGIDNLLYPQKQLIPFATRLDLALDDGSYSNDSQSGKAGLGWSICDNAILEVNNHFGSLADVGARNALLVVDELGRLELMHGEGLTKAMELLLKGSTKQFPNAIVVVRDMLLSSANDAFCDIWNDVCCIESNDTCRKQVISDLCT